MGSNRKGEGGKGKELRNRRLESRGEEKE